MMKNIFKTCLAVMTLLLTVSCTKEDKFIESGLQVTTYEFSKVSQTMAVGTAFITVNNLGNVSEMGFCWSQDDVPVVDGESVKVENVVQQGEFSVSISGLSPATTYRGRAYVIAASKVYYGNTVSFTTRDIPTDGWCVIDAMENLSVTSASAVMQIADDGNNDILEYGVCYSTSENPTVDDAVLRAPSGGAGFTADLKDLNQGTKYFIRPYFTTAAGVIYGEQKNFTTLNFILTTKVYAGFRAAYLFGQVYMDVDSPTKERGFVWSIEANPTIETGTRLVSGNKGNLVGNYWNLVGGFEKNTEYHLRAYAINDSGVYYGTEIVFTTRDGEILPGFSVDQMKKVEAGTFMMGNPNTDTQASLVDNQTLGSEKVHKVQLTKDYYMACYEVTNAQIVNFLNIYQPASNKSWDSVGRPFYNSSGRTYSFNFTGSAPNMTFTPVDGCDNKPASNITWYCGYLFLQWLSAELGITCRFPTEAEWEYAARGGKNSPAYNAQTGVLEINDKTWTYSGSNTLADVAHCPGGSQGTAQVGSLKANELGIFDMSGNVFEYCYDDFSYTTYTTAAELSVDPVVSRSSDSANSNKVIRGGSWRHANYAPICLRGRASTEQDCGNHSGMRIVMDALPDVSKL